MRNRRTSQRGGLRECGRRANPVYVVGEHKSFEGRNLEKNVEYKLCWIAGLVLTPYLTVLMVERLLSIWYM